MADSRKKSDSESETEMELELESSDSGSSSSSVPTPSSDSEHNDPSRRYMGDLPPGSTVENGRYEITKRIGKGYFSTVYLADDTFARRRVALKISKGGGSFLEAAQEEVKFLQKIGDHPNILRLFDFVFVKDAKSQVSHPCMVVECMWKDLFRVQQDFYENGLPGPLLKHVMMQILRAVDYMHNQGILHTDIKPENFLVSNEDCAVVKMADFGNACLVNKPYSSTIQTRHYRCPEVFLGCGYGTAADMFSCGVMFFELATGELPFEAHRQSNVYRQNEKQLQLMFRALGPFPRHMVKQGKFSHHYFNRRCEFLHESHAKPPRTLPHLLRAAHVSKSITGPFSHLLENLLQIDPQRRWTASQALEFVAGMKME